MIEERSKLALALGALSVILFGISIALTAAGAQDALQSTVHGALHPASASIWIRGGPE